MKLIQGLAQALACLNITSVAKHRNSIMPRDVASGYKGVGAILAASSYNCSVFTDRTNTW